MKWLWAPAHYWPVWLGVTIGTFLLREIWALATKHPQDTLSAFVWQHLHIVAKESIGHWTATDLLLFLTYVSVFVIWLPAHFWFRKFT